MLAGLLIMLKVTTKGFVTKFPFQNYADLRKLIILFHMKPRFQGEYELTDSLPSNLLKGNM